MNASRQTRWPRILVEVVVIVGSILLAFGIDRWWDGRREEAARRELVASLLSDVRAAEDRLRGSALQADSAIGRSRAFLSATNRLEEIPTDSLRYLLRGVFWSTPFAPALPAYEAAVATGAIGLLPRSRFLEEVTRFEGAAHRFAERYRLDLQLLYVGPAWEARREFGSLGAILYDPSACPDRARSCPYPARFELTPSELRAYASRPEVYALVENWLTLKVTQAEEIHSMLEALDRARAALEPGTGDRRRREGP